MSRKYLRQIFFIDHSVQGDLLRKAATAWLLSLTLLGMLTIVGWIYITPGLQALLQIRDILPTLLGMMVVSLLVALAVLPILLYDLAKLTNRFAGPVYNLQRSMKDLAEGKEVKPISFREGDYWLELAESFNGIVARLKSKQAFPQETVVPELETLVTSLPAEEPLNV